MSCPARSAHAAPTCAPSWPWPDTTKAALPIRLRLQIFWSSTRAVRMVRYMPTRSSALSPSVGVAIVQVQHRQVVGGGHRATGAAAHRLRLGHGHRLVQIRVVALVRLAALTLASVPRRSGAPRAGRRPPRW